MKFTAKDLDNAVARMSLMEFFPQDAKAALKAELASMCPSREALLWVTDTLISKAAKWPGIAEVRGLLCMRFDAADGIDRSWCSIPGYTADENEARYLAKHGAMKRLEQGEAKRLLESLKDDERKPS